MIALMQRVSEATVLVKQVDVTREAGTIRSGLVVLVGVEKGDTMKQADRILERLLAYRVFPDHTGRMNLNLEQVGGEMMLVSQFTLAANTNSGNRPSFSSAADPDTGRQLFDYLLAHARARLGKCATGEFGAHMMVRLVNDGPVTFRLRVPPGNTED